MRNFWVLGILFLAACASLEPELEGMEKTIWMLRDRYNEGIVVYKSLPGDKDLSSVIFKMTGPGQVDLTVQYRDFSLVYALGIKYDRNELSTEAKEAKIMYRIKDFTFLNNHEIHLQVPKEIAGELVQHERIKIELLVKPGTE
jgi:hypothetical protein